MKWHQQSGRALNPREMAKVNALAGEYNRWHWGADPDKVIEINDPLVPDVVGIGQLRDVEVGPTEAGAQGTKFPEGTWLAFDKSHPRHRLYIILTPEMREEVRNHVKHVRTVPLQEIAEATGGDHADYPLPRIQAHPLGVLQAVVYWTYKKGEEGDKPWEYKHVFGHEHARGIKPVLAADVSGRLWIAGGAYRCPYPGITG